MPAPAGGAAGGGAQRGDWSIAVLSIGEAGAGMVSALRPIAPVSEARMAQLLFQAPSVLAAGLSREVAEQANEILEGAGLETRLLGPGEEVEEGDADHEIAVVVHDVARMPEILAEVVKLVGVAPARARAMLCAAPSILVGKVSAGTVEVFRERFARLGAELDVTRPDDAVYDVFLGECSPAERARLEAALRELGIEMPEASDRVLVAMGLDRGQGERLWDKFARTNLPMRLISRDFERFDVTLEEAPDTPEMAAYLVESTGMPEVVAGKVIAGTPIVLHQQVGFERMTECVQGIVERGGRAVGHLLVFQTFALRLARVGDRDRAARLIQALTDCDERAAAAAVERQELAGPLTHTQARWLQWELQQAGTETERLLR